MKHFIFTPFSLATNLEYSKAIGNGLSWNTHVQPKIDGGASEEFAYCAYLYSEERMAYRFQAFEKICLARMIEATKNLDPQKWQWDIFLMVKQH